MFRLILFLLPPAIAGIWFVSIPRETVERADFVYVNPSGVNTLDPAQMSWTQDIRLAVNLWEGLTSYDPRTTEPVSGAAHFPPVISDDGLTYTFVIREDARWSNGDPLLADDFVRGWRRSIEPGTASDYASLILDHVVGARAYYEWRLAGVNRIRGAGADRDLRERLLRHHAADMDERFGSVGIEVVSQREVRVRLTSPTPYFLDLTGFPVFMPAHQSIDLLRQRFDGWPVDENGLVVYDPQWTKPVAGPNGYPGLVTNGAYRMLDWRFKEKIRLEVNPYVHGAGDIDCRTIDMFSIENLNTGIIAYEAGDVDFLPDMSVSYEPELVALSKNGIRADIISPLVFGTYYYHFNCRAELAGGRLNPFADARLRRAFALAVNKQAIVSYVTRRGEPVAGTLIPPGMIPGYESPNGLEFDPVEARRLLADAGFAGGSGLGPVEILYNTDFSHERIVQVLAEQWRRNLGVEIRLKGLETKTFGAQKADGQFMIARGGWYGDYLDPTTFLDTFVTGDGNNDCGFSNERFDELMSRADDELDAERRLAMLSRAERLLVEEELPVVPLFVFPNTMAIKPHVGGLYPNPRLMFLFRHVFLSK